MSVTRLFSLLLGLVATVYTQSGLGSVELQPGELSANLPADQILVYPCGDPAPLNAPFHDCEAITLPAENRFKIITTLRAPVSINFTNKGPAASTPLMQQLFHVAPSPSGEETTIPATIYIRPVYQGVVDARSFGVSASFSMTLTVQSRTTGRIVAHKKLEEVNVEGDYKIVKIPGAPIAVPLPIPSIEKPSETFLHVMTVNLIRGHFYKIELKTHSQAETLRLSFLGRADIDFFNDDMILPGEDNLIDPLFPREGPFIGWDFLQIEVGDDPFERIDALEEQLDAMQKELIELKSDLHDHSHKYKRSRFKAKILKNERTSPARPP